MAAAEVMKLRAVQWNIHGGLVRPTGSDPARRDLYTIPDLNYVIEELASQKPQIVTLQETQRFDPHNSQAKEIARQLKMNYAEADFGPSHFQPGARLSVAILSQFPIAFPEQMAFKNPNWTVQKPDGQIWNSHDKGVLKVRLPISYRKSLLVATLHGFPPHEFDTNFYLPENQDTLADMRQKMSEDQKLVPAYLIQGDFNIDVPMLTTAPPTLRRVVPPHLHGVLINEPTLATGETVDHVLYRGMTHKRTSLRFTRSDHKMVTSNFEITV